MTSSFSIRVDWAKDGEWEAAGDDVTGRVRGPISIEYGRDQSTALAPTVAGRGSFTLDNRSGDYTSRNTSSPLFGKLKPGRPVRIQRSISGDYTDTYADTYSVSGSGPTITLFRGHTDDTPLNPNYNERNVTVGLVDALADFRNVTINTSLYFGIRTGDAIGYILDAAGWTGGRDLDAGATYIRHWWADNKDALTALEELVRSEGPPALLTVGADGSIIFKDRHHRLIDSTALTSQQTWHATEGQTPTIHREGFTYDEAWAKIVNTGAASVDVRTPRPTEDVWTSEETITLGASETRQIIATPTDPFYDAVTPVDGTDFETTLGTVTVSLSRTSGGSTTITITASGGGAVIIRNLKLRAKPIQTAYTVQAAASDAASIIDYGQRSFPGDLPWCNQYDAQAVLTTAVEMRAQPLPVVTARFVVATEDAQTPVLDADLSHRVTVDVPELDLNDAFYVENIRHDWQSEFDHAITIGMEAAPLFPTPVFRFNTTGAGFNDGKFATMAAEPATIFQFNGGSGHRFNEGVFVT